MKHFIGFTGFLHILVLGFASALWAQDAQAQGAQEGRYGAWAIICDAPQEADESDQCALMQNVIAQDREQVGLSVVIKKSADGNADILRILAPLGVILVNGLGLDIDGKDMGRAQFVRCVRDGCFAEMILDESLLERFRKGRLATFVIFETPEEGIGIPVSLNGFSRGYDNLSQ